jgi:hypothetical protein
MRSGIKDETRKTVPCGFAGMTAVWGVCVSQMAPLSVALSP